MRKTIGYAGLAAALMALSSWAGAGHAAAAEINVLSAGAVRSVVSTVSDTFAKETGNSVKGTFGTVGVVRQKLAAGEPAESKTLLWPGGYAAEAVADGRAELVVHQISEILPVKGVTLVGPLPKELQKITIYSAGLATKAASPEAARAFVGFLASPPVKAKFAAAGLDFRE